MAEDRASPQFHLQVFREGSQTGVRVGVDVDVKIVSFSFEDAEKTHKLAFEIDNFDLSQFDNPTFVNGDLISFSYGYDGNMSLTQQAIVMNSYGGARHGAARHVQIKSGGGPADGGTKLKIEALGKEILMNKDAKTRSFTNMRRCDVARQIAGEQGFSGSNVTIDEVGVGQAVILQSRMTDYAFLRQLAQKDGAELYIDATGFHYHQRKFGQTPTKTLTYYTDGTGSILSFTVHNDRTAKPGTVAYAVTDPLKKLRQMIVGDDKSTAGRPSLAPVPTVLGEQVNDKTGAITPDTPLTSRTSSIAVVASTATTIEDAQAQANAAYVNTQSGAVRLKLHCVGDPLVRAKQVIVVQGLGAMHNGRYYITLAKHTVTNGGYTMDLECRRDGVNSGAGSTAAKPPAGSGAPNTKPAGDPNDLVPVEVVDEKNGVTRVEYKPKGCGGT